MLILFVACGPSEEEVQDRIDYALEQQEYKHEREIKKAVADAVFQATSTTLKPKDNRFENSIKYCNLGTGSYSGVTLSENGDSLYLNGDGDEDRTTLKVENILCVLTQLETPQTIITRMSNTNSTMGLLEDNFEGIKVSWTYHPDNGLDIYFRLEK